jgi:hypothetical protein
VKSIILFFSIFWRSQHSCYHKTNKIYKMILQNQPLTFFYSCIIIEFEFSNASSIIVAVKISTKAFNYLKFLNRIIKRWNNWNQQPTHVIWEQASRKVTETTIATGYHVMRKWAFCNPKLCTPSFLTERIIKILKAWRSIGWGYCL